jgi:hypothetical protein
VRREADSAAPRGTPAIITIRSRCKRQLASARRIRDKGTMRTIYRKFQFIGQSRARLAVAAGSFIFAAAPQIISLDAASSVSIELQGEIEPECQLNAGSSTVELGSIVKSGSKQISFGINCNAPFSYAVVSQSGGLQNADSTTVRAGFTSFVVYSVGVAIQTDGGTIAGACPSAALTARSSTCSYPDSGNKIAIHQAGSLTLSWSSTDELVAGPYVDVLTLSLQPRL